MTDFPYEGTVEAEEQVRALARQRAGEPPGSSSSLENGAPPWAWRCHDEELVRVLRDDPVLFASWVSSLSASLRREATECLRDARDAERASAARMIESWQEEPDVLALWNGSHLRNWSHLMFWPSEFRRLGRLLVELSPQAAATSLEVSLHPGMVTWVVSDDGDRFASTLALFSASDVVLSGQGEWIGRRVVALVSLRALPRTLQTFADQLATDVRCARNEEAQAAALLRRRDWHTRSLPALASELARAVLARPEGKHLSVVFAALLHHELQSRNPSVDLPGESVDDRLSPVNAIILRSLAEEVRGLPLPLESTVARWTAHADREAERVAAAPKAVAPPERSTKIPASQGEGAASLKGEGLGLLTLAIDALGEPADSHTAAALWSTIEARLVGADPSFAWAARRPGASDVARRLGRVLALQPDPDTSLRRAYARLEPQRRRSRFPVRYDGDHANEQSVVLLKFGLRAADYMRVHSFDASSYIRIFDSVEIRARRLWLTSALDTEELAEHLWVSCFAFAARFEPAERDARILRMLHSSGSRSDLALRGLAHVVDEDVPTARVHALASEAGLDVARLASQVEEGLSRAFIDHQLGPTLVDAAALLELPPLTWDDPSGGFRSAPPPRPRRRRAASSKASPP